MTMPISLRLTAEQHARIREHLYPGDGCEAVALALCGRSTDGERTSFSVHEILPVPYAEYSERTSVSVRWNVGVGLPLFQKAAQRRMAVLKIHSHPSGYERFSEWDDASDSQLLGGLSNWTDSPSTHLSAFMLPDGRITARTIGATSIATVDHVMVVGDEIHRWSATEAAIDAAYDIRTCQVFGEGTVRALRGLRVGVIGTSGTGSWVVEILARLGVGHLVLVDPDRVERKNLNRIVNSTAVDAEGKRLKVDVLGDAVSRIGANTTVTRHPTDAAHSTVITSLSQCDVLVGCVDSADGRDLANRIATYYLIPYLDVGVRIDADGHGSISQACLAIHYLIPGGSSLLSRGVITTSQITSDSLHRRNPAAYAEQVERGYIRGVNVERPAVISLNALAATTAVNELLARLHSFRTDGNEESRYQIFSLTENNWLPVKDGLRCDVLARHVGRGDCTPLLGDPTIT